MTFSLDIGRDPESRVRHENVTKTARRASVSPWNLLMNNVYPEPADDS